MDIVQLLADQSLKAIQKREQIAGALEHNQITAGELNTYAIDDKGTGIILEAMEAVSRKNPALADADWLNYAGSHILSTANALKREASRVVGNIAHVFPDQLGGAVQNLLKNTADAGTVVRWGSAYALGRIVLIPRYANSDLFDTLAGLAERETENGVKNQYLAGLKKAKKLRESTTSGGRTS